MKSDTQQTNDAIQRRVHVVFISACNVQLEICISRPLIRYFFTVILLSRDIQSRPFHIFVLSLQKFVVSFCHDVCLLHIASCRMFLISPYIYIAGTSSVMKTCIPDRVGTIQGQSLCLLYQKVETFHSSPYRHTHQENLYMLFYSIIIYCFNNQYSRSQSRGKFPIVLLVKIRTLDPIVYELFTEESIFI